MASPDRSTSRAALADVGPTADPLLRAVPRVRLDGALLLAAGLVLMAASTSAARPEPPPDVFSATAPAVSESGSTPLPSPAGHESPAGQQEPKPTSSAQFVPVPVGSVSLAATGRLATVPGEGRPGARRGRIVTYRVRVEKGLMVAGDPVDAKDFAHLVHSILTDPRGWERIDRIRFKRVSSARAHLDVVLASPKTTDALCWPLRTRGKLSCHNRGRAVLNARRWFSGAKSYGDDLIDYRRYLVTHEVGHHLGHPHETCQRRGAKAPVMQQQTKSLRGCRRSPWPTGS